MADNLTTTTTVSTVPSGSVIATDDVAGVHFQKVKLDVGGDGASAVLGNANPLPVSDAGGSLTVDGTVAVSSVSGTVNIADVWTDDSAHAPGVSTVMPVGYRFDDTAPDSVDEGDVGIPRMSANRNAYTTLRDAAGNERGANVNASNQLAVSVDNTVTVASHAVTNAGTFATQVDGAALTALQLIDNIVVVEDAAAAGGESGVQMLGVRKDAAGTLASTDGDFTPVQMDADGNVRVNVVTGGTAGTQYTEDAAAAANPVGTALNLIRADALAALTSADGDNVAARGTDKGELYVKHVDALTVSSHAVTNAGTFAVQVDGAALTSLQLIDDAIKTDDAAFTPGTDEVMMAGFEADETATDSVDEGDAGAARMTLDRKLIVTPYPHTAGGLSIHRSIDLDEGTLEIVKASPGQVYGMWVTNTATATRWIKFYDATSGTVGTGTPVITIGIPGNTSDDISGNFGPGGMGIAFATGICVGASTGVADADTGAPGANDVIVNIFFK